LFINEKDDYIFVPLFNAISAFISLILGLLVIAKKFKLKLKIPTLRDLFNTYQSGWRSFVGQFAPNLYNNTAVLLLGLFSSNSTVGLYTSATKIIDAVISLGYILSNTFLPYLSRDFNKHIFFQKIMLVAGFLLMFFVYFFSDSIVLIMFGKDNLDIAVYVRLLSVTILFVFCYLVYNTNYLMICGYELLASNIALYVSVVAFIFTFLSCYLHGIHGAVFSLILARGALSVISFYFYIRINR